MRISGLLIIRTTADLVTTAQEQGNLTEVVQKYLESDDTEAQRAVCEVILELLEEGDEETKTQRCVSPVLFRGVSCSLLMSI